jgi:O-acetylserine/cysteine efflux transporter
VLMIMYSAVFATCVGATLWLYLVREEDVTVLSSSSYLIPMVAVCLGWLLLGEDVELGSILGMGLILAGVYLVNRSRSA